MIHPIKNWIFDSNNSLGARFTPFKSILPLRSISLALKRAQIYEKICSTISEIKIMSEDPW
jgi:hypothetical protein